MQPTILTCAGTMFDFREPERNIIEIEQIAHALSNLCRFTGHTNRFYSVAQHSLLVASIVPPEFQLEALLHDAHEAFVGDVATPLKTLIPDYHAVEKRVETAVRSRFCMTPTMSAVVKRADLIALATEKLNLMPDSEPWHLGEDIRPLDKPIVPMMPSVASLMFLAAYDSIKNYGAIQQ